jgi:hypothetical protein
MIIVTDKMAQKFRVASSETEEQAKTKNQLNE